MTLSAPMQPWCGPSQPCSQQASQLASQPGQQASQPANLSQGRLGQAPSSDGAANDMCSIVQIVNFSLMLQVLLSLFLSRPMYRHARTPGHGEGVDGRVDNVGRQRFRGRQPNRDDNAISQCDNLWKLRLVRAVRMSCAALNFFLLKVSFSFIIR